MLYTDADVIFQADPGPPPWPLPTFAAGTEGFSTSMNSGVMWMNMTTFQAEWSGLLGHAARKHFVFWMAEQQWLLATVAAPRHATRFASCQAVLLLCATSSDSLW